MTFARSLRHCEMLDLITPSAALEDTPHHRIRPLLCKHASASELGELSDTHPQSQSPSTCAGHHNGVPDGSSQDVAITALRIWTESLKYPKFSRANPVAVPLEVLVQRASDHPLEPGGESKRESRRTSVLCCLGCRSYCGQQWLRLSRLPRLSSTRPADLADRMSTRSAEGEASPPDPSAADACASRHEGTHPRQASVARVLLPMMHVRQPAIDMCMRVSSA